MNVGDLVIPDLTEILKRNDGEFDLAFQGEDYAVYWMLHMVPLKIAQITVSPEDGEYIVTTESTPPFHGGFMWATWEVKPYTEQELIGNRVMTRLYGLQYDTTEIGDIIPDEAS